jgi:hypothetical protein
MVLRMGLHARTDQIKAIMEGLRVILDYYLIFLLHVQYIHISATEKYHMSMALLIRQE